MDLLLPSLGVRGYRRPFAFRVHIVNVRRLRYFGGTAGQTGSRTSQSSSRVKNSCYFGLANLSRDCLLCEHFAPEISQTDTHTHRVVVVSRSEGSVTRDATHFLTHGRDAYTHTHRHIQLCGTYTQTHTRGREWHTRYLCFERRDESDDSRSGKASEKEASDQTRGRTRYWRNTVCVVAGPLPSSGAL